MFLIRPMWTVLQFQTLLLLSHMKIFCSGFSLILYISLSVCGVCVCVSHQEHQAADQNWTLFALLEYIRDKPCVSQCVLVDACMRICACLHTGLCDGFFTGNIQKVENYLLQSLSLSLSLSLSHSLSLSLSLSLTLSHSHTHGSEIISGWQSYGQCRKERMMGNRKSRRKGYLTVSGVTNRDRDTDRQTERQTYRQTHCASVLA